MKSLIRDLLISLALIIALVAVSHSRGTRYDVKPGDDLKTIIARALPGDEIVLQAGGTWDGELILDKADGAAIIIRSSAVLPERTICAGFTSPDQCPDLPLMATLSNVTNNASPVTINRGNWRFDGINFRNATTINNGEMVVVEGATVTLDRVRINANAEGLKRGVRANGRVTVTRSHIARVTAPGQDSQAICAWDTSGPLTFTNNYLEAASENIMLGGADSSTAERVPSDVLIEGNIITKRLEWNSMSDLVIKNLLELKAARRVIIRRNAFSNSWSGSQAGHAIMITPVNQLMKAPWTVVEDILIAENTFRNVERGFSVNGYGYKYENAPGQGGSTRQTTRVTIRDNDLAVQYRGFAVANDAGAIGIYRNKVAMPEGVILSLTNEGKVWPTGEVERQAKYAAAALIWAENIVPSNTYIHSPTALNEAALKSYTGTYSLVVDDSGTPPPPPPIPDPPTDEDKTAPVIDSLGVVRTGSSSNYKVTVVADDDRGISRVDIYVDGILKNIMSAPTSGTMTYLSGVKIVAPGQHAVRVTIYDGAGNRASLEKSVTR